MFFINVNLRYVYTLLSILFLTILIAVQEVKAQGESRHKKRSRNRENIEKTPNTQNNQRVEDFPGHLKATVVDYENAEPLIGVTYHLTGHKISGQTDEDGRFEIRNLKPGNYNLVLSYVSYLNDTLKNIKVESGKTLVLNHRLVGEGVALSTVEIVEDRVTANNEIASIGDIRLSKTVINTISKEQINKTLDRDAAEIIKRVPGVTIIQNKMLLIRGLNERYNNVLINDVIAPSIEIEKRAFSFDLIPNSIIDRLQVYKSASSDLPGDFAGGLVKIYTNTAPTGRQISADISVMARAGTTFSSFRTDGANALSWLGIEDGSYALPNIPTNLNRRVPSQFVRNSYGHKFENTWGLVSSNAPFDKRLAVDYSNIWGKGFFKVGSITSVNYYQMFTAFGIERNDFESNEAIFKYQDKSYTELTRFGFMQNFLFVLGKNHKIEWQNMLIQSGDNNATIREGYLASNVNKEILSYANSFLERRVYSGQMHGTHKWARGKQKLEWISGGSIALRNEPDFRRLRYTREEDKFVAIMPRSGSEPPENTEDASRFFAELNEQLVLGRLDYERQTMFIKYPVTLKTGILTHFRQRDFTARTFYYANNYDLTNQELLSQPIETIFGAKNVRAGGFEFNERFTPSNSYTATNFYTAAYVSWSQTFSQEKGSLQAGVRYEHNTQTLESAISLTRAVRVDYPLANILPSINLAYRFSQRSNLRLAYFRSLNRPEFRELAPFTFINYEFNTYILGNQRLKVCTIDNLDLRWELYPEVGEIVSIGMFYKQFANPIENIVVANSGAATRTYTFSNAQSVYNLGIELEYRRKLSFIKSNLFKDLSLVTNFTFLQSRVELGAAGVGQSNKRPLQGQSPYVVNVGLFYLNDLQGIQASLLYNVFAPRIFVVGFDAYPDVYELSRHLVDLTVSKSISKYFDVQVGVQDILNQPMIYIQDRNKDKLLDPTQDNIIMRFRPGSYYTIGLRYKLK